MEKKIINKFGTHYLLGKQKDGTYLWVEEPSFDCGWYWGGIYLHTYSNNRQPTRSVDLSSHTHFDSEFLDKGNCYDSFMANFSETVLDKQEIWRLLELCRTFYTLKDAASLFMKGSSWISKNDCYDVIKDQNVYEEIVKVKIPAVLEAILKLLGGTKTKEAFAEGVNIL